ncbi:DUF3189 family protein [Pelotomaculum isophthalicicum JI]|uniref:DUF3189 family protein n=1 Tax=Pelotomaculum isophthalicicum JI TaxID=947010 RepID=A0A9X4H0N9_9FIRM|nr:DUF3189 family protein [Pelotomaculum isophthalicicum]MDF9407365.1 DUF3189 family protein [Pelotomaculum isophthalicicum JI]
MKKILYFSSSKFPIAGLAGAIHSGMLPEGKESAVSVLWNLPFMNSNQNSEGVIISLGEDKQGNKIFALSVKGDRELINRLIESIISIFKRAPDELYLVNIKFKENSFVRTGWRLCHSALLAPLGRAIIIACFKKIYVSLSQLVSDQKEVTGKLT